MNKVLGIDISAYQTNDYTNPTKFFDPYVARDRGIKFAILRASIGTVKDRAVDHFAEEFYKAGIPMGYYHFLHTGVSYTSQADFFCNIVRYKSHQLPLFVDVEMSGVGLDMTRRFIGRVEAKLNKPVWIYSSPGFWNSLVGVDRAEWVLDKEYWVANYIKPPTTSYLHELPDGYPNENMPKELKPFIGKKSWKFWQFTSSGDGRYFGGDYPAHSKPVGLDLDVYNGTVEQFNEEFGSAISPPQSEFGMVRVIARQSDGKPGWLFFRDEPSFDYIECLAVGYGTVLLLMSPEPINGMWHVKTTRGREGFVSAGEKYTEVI